MLVIPLIRVWTNNWHIGYQECQCVANSDAFCCTVPSDTTWKDCMAILTREKERDRKKFPNNVLLTTFFLKCQNNFTKPLLISHHSSTDWSTMWRTHQMFNKPRLKTIIIIKEQREQQRVPIGNNLLSHYKPLKSWVSIEWSQSLSKTIYHRWHHQLIMTDRSVPISLLLV